MVVKDRKRLPISSWVAPEIAALIRQCWEDDPRKRPTMRQVVSRLEAIDKWDTDGRLWRAAAGLEPPAPPSPSPKLSPQRPGGTGFYTASPGGKIEPGRPGSRVAAIIATAGARARPRPSLPLTCSVSPPELLGAQPCGDTCCGRRPRPCAP